MTRDLYRMWGGNIRLFRLIKDKREGRSKYEGVVAMAQSLEVATETVYRWERGKVVPRDSMKIEIAKYLEIPPERIFPLVEGAGVTEIHDWGGDMAAYNAWFAEQGGWDRLTAGRAKFDDDGRTRDRMFDRTRYEQKSYEAYSRLLDQGHRA